MEDRLDSVWRHVLHPHALRVGDEAIVVSDEAKTMDTNYVGVSEGSGIGAWGFPCTIVGFAIRHVGRWKAREEGVAPGFYHCPYFPQVRFAPDAKPSGVVDKEGFFIHASGLMLTDQKAYRERVAELFTRHDDYRRFRKGARQADLPDTAFWEGDWVRVRDGVTAGDRRLPEDDRRRDGACMVSGLDFSLQIAYVEERKKFCYLESPQQAPRYVLTDRFLMGGGSYWKGEELELAARGNFWKLAHGERPAFADLDEEAHHFCESGASEIVADAEGRKWHRQRETAQAAVAQGHGHGIRYEFDGAGWDSESWWEIIRFRDDDLGRRVAAATEDGFVIPSDSWLQHLENERRMAAFYEKTGQKSE